MAQQPDDVLVVAQRSGEQTLALIGEKGLE
jgi:hypothetical protein